MIVLLWLGLPILTSPFKANCRVVAENVALRFQVMALQR
jgi:hypothetical protein